MDLATSIAEFRREADRLAEALKPHATAFQQSIVEVANSYLAWMDSQRVEACEWLIAMDSGVHVILIGLVVASLAAGYERAVSRRREEVPVAEAMSEPVRDEVFHSAAHEKPSCPKPVPVASPQRKRPSAVPVETTDSRFDGRRPRSDSLLMAAQAEMESRRRSSTPGGLPQAAATLEPSDPEGVLHALNTWSPEELSTVRGVGPVSIDKILRGRRLPGGFSSMDDVPSALGGKMHAVRIVSSIDDVLRRG
mmetsp:Transcript_24111/g.45526  ORF Transcript_24111/g.45526 Transcript_24111/m.45526 type:complete len:251 (+) Transcript_24111:67-819(+)